MESVLDIESYERLESTAKDAPTLWPGTPPNYGKEVVSHIDTVAGTAGLSGYAYLNADEAIRDDPQNSERMRADCGVMECLEARYRAVSLCNWHLEISNDKCPLQIAIKDQLTKIIEATPDFVGMRLWLSEAVYYGRSGVALKYSSQEIDGFRRIAVDSWEPRHGDKFAFRMPDHSGKVSSKQVGIRVALAGTKNLNQRQIGHTAEGMVYWFNPLERKTFILHKHLREDGPFDNPWTAGRIHGVGVRSRIYWTWYAMVECMQRAMEYLDRSAFGVELWRYPGNSPAAKAQTEMAAKRVISGGRTVILVPTFSGDMADSYGVEHIEPGLQGFDRLMDVIRECFAIKIKRYVMGQTLTSEADATGMGSGVADAHLATFADIVSCDAQRLAETLTNDFVRHLQLWNFPGSEHVRIRFKIDTESDDAKEKMQAITSAYAMGAKIKVDDVAKAAGISIPTDSDDVLFKPDLIAGMEQYRQQRQPVQASGGMLSIDPFARAIQNALGQGA